MRSLGSGLGKSECFTEVIGEAGPSLEVKIPRFRCTGSMILVSNILVDVCTFTRN